VRLADFTAIWDYVGELQARIAQLEQYQEWAQPQIVTHGEDRIRIVQLEQLLRDVRPWMGEAPYALADRIDAVLTAETPDERYTVIKEGTIKKNLNDPPTGPRPPPPRSQVVPKETKVDGDHCPHGNNLRFGRCGLCDNLKTEANGFDETGLSQQSGYDRSGARADKETKGEHDHTVGGYFTDNIKNCPACAEIHNGKK